MHTLMQHLITDQKLAERNSLFHSRVRKLINLQPTAKVKKRKSVDRQNMWLSTIKGSVISDVPHLFILDKTIHGTMEIFNSLKEGNNVHVIVSNSLTSII